MPNASDAAINRAPVRSRPPQNLQSWTILAILGITSSIVSMTLPGSVATFPFIGGIFGVALAVYLALYGGARSPFKWALLIAGSSVAYPSAFFGSVLLMRLPLPTFGVSEEQTTRTLVFGGGIIGGFLLLLAVFFALLPARAIVGAVFGKAAIGSLFSGFLGLFAWSLGPSVGKALWAGLPISALPRPDSFNFCSLYLIWQTVMALLIGFIAGREIPAASNQSLPISLRASGSSVSKKALIGTLALVTAVVLVRAVPIRIRAAGWQDGLAKKLAETPPLDNLKPLQPLTLEQALILQDIGGSHLGPTAKRVEMVSHEKGSNSPPGMYYAASYSPGAGNIAVSVEQYPNSEWARYFAKYPPRIYNSFDDPKHHAVVTKFQSRVRSNLLEDPGVAVPLYYMWPSGDFLVTVTYNGSHENEEILRMYLEKYPSSITEEQPR
jgi:hypothetical protein